MQTSTKASDECVDKSTPSRTNCEAVSHTLCPPFGFGQNKSPRDFDSHKCNHTQSKKLALLQTLLPKENQPSNLATTVTMMMKQSYLFGLVSALLASTISANNVGHAQSVVSLWHMYQDENGDVVFWDSSAAPILEDSPEFLHTRQKAPTGVAYEIDVTTSTMSIAAADVSDASRAAIAAGQFDRYYLFVDQTEQLTTLQLQDSAPTGVTVQRVPKGTILQAKDRNNRLDLDFELRTDAVLIEMGPNTPLKQDDFKVVVSYERIVGEDPPADAANNNNLRGADSAASYNHLYASLVVSSLLATLSTMLL